VVVAELPHPLPPADVIDLGIGSQAFEQSEGVRALDELVHLVLGVLEVPEGQGPGRAVLDTGGHVRAVLQVVGVLPLGTGGVLGLIETMVAKGALFHHAARPHRGQRGQGLFHAFGPDRIVPAEVTDMVWAGRHAVPAADAAGVDLADDAAVLVFIRGHDRAHGDAGRIAALLARPGQIRHVVVRKGLSVGQLVNEHPGRGPHLIGGVGLRIDVVLRLTGGHAGPAAGAFVEIDHHAPGDREFLEMLSGHDGSPLTRVRRW